MTLIAQQMKTLLATLALLCGVALAQAQSNQAAGAQDGPAALVLDISTQVIEAVKADKSVQAGSPAAVQKLVEARILPHVEFEKTTRLAVGRGWRDASPEQRTRLVEEFRTLLVRTYAGALSSARDHKVRLLATRAQGDADVIVRTQVVAPGTDPIALDYRLEKTDAGWKIYDVGVLGVWLVQTYQTSFANEISQGGIDGLIRSLAARNRQNAEKQS